MTIESNQNQKKWQTIIKSQISSGQTQAECCEEQSVNINIFRYWKGRLKNKAKLSARQEKAKRERRMRIFQSKKFTTLSDEDRQCPNCEETLH